MVKTPVGGLVIFHPVYSTLLSEVVISIFLSIKYIAQFTSTEKPIVIRLLNI